MFSSIWARSEETVEFEVRFTVEPDDNLDVGRKCESLTVAEVGIAVLSSRLLLVFLASNSRLPFSHSSIASDFA